ncbi:MAG: RNA polymerase sigma factor [Myxococcota bacterium]
MKQMPIDHGQTVEPGLTAAFERLVIDQRERAIRTAWQLTRGDRSMAEEIVQEALLKATHQLGSLRDNARIEAWFFRIVTRTALSHHRRRKVTDRILALVGAVPPAREVAGDPLLRDAIEDAMRGLTDAQRVVFVLVHLQGFTIAEAAEIRGRSIGTMKSHLHRALETLRVRLHKSREESE